MNQRRFPFLRFIVNVPDMNFVHLRANVPMLRIAASFPIFLNLGVSGIRGRGRQVDLVFTWVNLRLNGWWFWFEDKFVEDNARIKFLIFNRGQFLDGVDGRDMIGTFFDFYIESTSYTMKDQ